MADSVSQSESSKVDCSLAKPLAPEDVCVGDYVAPLHETYELPTFLWGCDSGFVDRSEMIPVRFVPDYCVAPLKVEAICLPFVLVKHPVRGRNSLDVRRYQLARLDQSFGRIAWKALKPGGSKSKRRGKKAKQK